MCVYTFEHWSDVALIPTINSTEDLHGIEIEADAGCSIAFNTCKCVYIVVQSGAEFLKTYLQINVLCTLANYYELWQNA